MYGGNGNKSQYVLDVVVVAFTLSLAESGAIEQSLVFIPQLHLDDRHVLFGRACFALFAWFGIVASVSFGWDDAKNGLGNDHHIHSLA